MIQNIEVDARSFISEEEYKELLEYFHKNGSFAAEDYRKPQKFLVLCCGFLLANNKIN